MSDIFEWYKKIDRLKADVKPLRLTPFNWHIQYLEEAVKCFHERLCISCIVVSSALVETCLCYEHFRQNPKDTIGLEEFRKDNLHSLFDEFLNSNIPLELLVDADENVEEIRKMEKGKERRRKIGRIKYIKTRNKFAHGDLFYQIINLESLLPLNERELLGYGIDAEWKKDNLKPVAYVHLSKTLRFMKAFTDLLNQREKTARILDIGM